jgi:hypothetical protein
MVAKTQDVKLQILKDASFGERIAELEMKDLASYFVETDQWRQLVAGEKDIVYGAKGSGKSALYSLLVQKQEELFDRGILVVPAEQPSGTPAFKDVAKDPPAGETEFIGVWKLYFLSLIGKVLQEWGIESAEARVVYSALADAKLLDASLSFHDRLRRVLRYIRSARPDAVETSFALDPNTGMPIAVTGRIVLGDVDPDWRSVGYYSVDHLLAEADRALQGLDFEVWIVLDRLDVAFIEQETLEQNALRALFKAYLDMRALEKVSLKVFLRTDIWRKITRAGFREASHITRGLTITWERQSLLHLMMRRALKNQAICDYYGVDIDRVAGNVAEQERLIGRMLPDQVDAGKNPATLDWMLTRTQDGTGAAAPRELIHLLSSVRDSQIKRFELGHEPPPDELLFDRPAFKDALREVSEVRLTQTLYAEYPDLRPFVEHLDGEKTQQTLSTLSALWGIGREEARKTASALVDVGFFEARGAKEDPSYWVPFLYRDGLNMVQGEAPGFLQVGRQVVDRVADDLVASIPLHQTPRVAAAGQGPGFEDVHVLFNDPRSGPIAVWIFAAEPRTPKAMRNRAEIIGVGLKQGVDRELDQAGWRIRLNDSGFRWYKHVEQAAGYRLIVDAGRFNVESNDFVVRTVSERMMRALLRANLIDTGPARETPATEPLF